MPNPISQKILSHLHRKVGEIRFSRLDLGLPVVLGPIRKEDYILGCGAVCGCAVKDDGSDTFDRYLNGGCCVSDQIHWFNAHFRIGAGKDVLPQLAAMAGRQAKPVYPNGGSYQNGIVDSAGRGAEFFSWTGEPTGYEGHLVYSWFPLQGELTQKPEYLNKIFRPMISAQSGK